MSKVTFLFYSTPSRKKGTFIQLDCIWISFHPFSVDKKVFFLHGLSPRIPGLDVLNFLTTSLPSGGTNFENTCYLLPDRELKAKRMQVNSHWERMGQKLILSFLSLEVITNLVWDYRVNMKLTWLVWYWLFVIFTCYRFLYDTLSENKGLHRIVTFMSILDCVEVNQLIAFYMNGNFN